MKNTTIKLIGTAIIFAATLSYFAFSASAQELKPFKVNTWYWEYKGNPVMLLGGSKDDNLFQIPDLENHLDLMKMVGGNYIRNTMSSRDSGNVQAFKQLDNGKYNLAQWNPEYWARFERMLMLTAERNIFVQVELWDQWDYNDGRWESNPWNPDQNINYSVAETHLKGNGHYADVNHLLGQGKPLTREDSLTHGAPLDFFLTVPSLNNDTKVLDYQKRFIDKVLSYTLQYDHILYTISNELFMQHSPQWSYYWAEYLQTKANEKGVPIQITEMLHHHDIKHRQHRQIFDHPEVFTFVDVSQNAVQKNPDLHWQNLQWVRDYISRKPRPINHTKTYGKSRQSVPMAWKNIMGGAASFRFHRPPSGIGLNEDAQTHLKSLRMWLKEYDIFTSQPDSEHRLLNNREPEEAFCCYRQDRQYSVYFPDGGEVGLKVSKGKYQLRWLNIEKNKWEPENILEAENELKIITPEKGNWLALVTLVNY